MDRGPCFTAGMASSEMSIRHRVRVQPDPSVPVEAVLLAVGDRVGHANLSHASRMNKGVVVFVKEERLVADLLASGVTLNGLYLQVSPLAVPFTRITVSGVPPFIPNKALEQELQRFGKMASGFKTVGLGCKSDKLKHVQSFRRQVHMFLTCPSQTLDVSFRVRHGEGNYMVYASSGSMKCFECGDVGHRRAACPHRPAGGRTQTAAVAGDEAAAVATANTAERRRSDSAPPTESGGGQDSSRQIVERAAETVAVDSSAALEERPGATEEIEEVQTAGGEVRGGHSSRGQAAGVEVRREESGGTRSVGEDEDGMYCDSDSDCVSVADSQSLSADMYTLEDINTFLDETFGRSVIITDYFPDPDKYMKTVTALQKMVGVDILDEKKRFRLKKHMTALRKTKKGKGIKRLKAHVLKC